jgi:hypothetical protein
MFLFSCKENKNGIILDEKTESVLLSEIVDSVTYIELETVNECLIGYINNIKYINQNYYIYDNSAKTIYVFDENGKYKDKFCRYGQGYGEYLGFSTFRIDNGKLHISDNIISKILVYDMKTGAFEHGIDIDRDCPRDFLVRGNEYILFMPDKGKRQGAFVFSPESKKYKKIMDIDNWNKGLLLLNIYFINDSTLFDNASNGVYRIKDRSISNQYIFNFNKKYNNDTDKGYQIYSCCESGNIFAFFSAYFEGSDEQYQKMFVSLYNKRTGKVRTFDKITNDIDNRKIYGDMWSLNNKIIHIIYGEEDKTGFEKNPILQILHFKDSN